MESTNSITYLISKEKIKKHVTGGNIMTILITGGTGYIGSHTIVELLQSDYEVIIIPIW